MAHVKATVKFDPVDPSLRNSVADTVQHLVQSILSNSIEPGEKLPSERQLVEMLGVTRSTLRESLKTLALIGVVQIRQGDGTYVSTETSSMLSEVVSWGMLLNTTEARQLIEARFYLETSLAELAAIRSTKDERSRLGELLKKMEDADCNAQEFAEYDSEFHLEISRSAKNPVLSSTLQNTKSLLQAWVERVVENSTGRSWVIEQHNEILKAIESQDATAARQAMGIHLQTVTKRLLSSLDDAKSDEK